MTTTAMRPEVLPTAPTTTVTVKLLTVAGVFGERWTDHLWRLGSQTPCLVCCRPVGPTVIYTDLLPTFVAPTEDAPEGEVFHPAFCPECAVLLAEALLAACDQEAVAGEPLPVHEGGDDDGDND